MNQPAIKRGATLKRALLGNALFSVVSGLTIVMAHDAVLAWLGLEGINIAGIGFFLILFAAYLFWLASRKDVSALLVKGVIAGDWLWVVGSALLLALVGKAFSTTGWLLIIIIAVIVAGFAIWQGRGLKQNAGR